MAQAVYAISTDGSRYYYVETAGVGRRFTPLDNPADSGEWGAYKLLGLAPGDYYVLTAVRDLLMTIEEGGMSTGVTIASGSRTTSSTRFDAGYTKSVLCGLQYGCNDHTLVPVHVSVGTAVSGINPGDWYVGDPSFYPLIPGGGPPALSLGWQPAGSQDPRQAAIYYSQLHTSARYAESSSGCKLNLSCVWFTAEHQGTAAAYFSGEVGTNGVVRTCTFYLTKTASGWQFFDSNCRRLATAFPGVGASGQLEFGFGGTGCINLHSTPGLTAKIVACLPEGTNVTLDDGPYYLPEPTPTPDFGINYWWHVANRGWVVHRYVMYSA